MQMTVRQISDMKSSKEKFAKRIFIYLSLMAYLLLFTQSCATPVQAPPPSKGEVLVRDGKVGRQLSPLFETKVKTETINPSATEVMVYLRELSEKIATSDPALKGAPIGVLIIDDRLEPANRAGNSEKWRNYSLPGNRIYLSRGFIRSISSESELAAAIALELGHIAHRHVMSRVELFTSDDPAIAQAGQSPVIYTPEFDRTFKPEEVQFFGPAGVFYYSENQYGQASEAAVDLLYGSGFDPRGLTSLWNIYLSHPDRSPYEPSVIPRLIQRTRDAIAKLTPLRNPVVRSQRFVAIFPRLKQI